MAITARPESRQNPDIWTDPTADAYEQQETMVELIANIHTFISEEEDALVREVALSYWMVPIEERASQKALAKQINHELGISHWRVTQALKQAKLLVMEAFTYSGINLPANLTGEIS